ncbi:MAG: 50S ribosomal protein L25 [Candidatus Magasanikbacteria bacterium]
MAYLLQAVTRTIKGAKSREEGKLPAVTYGAGNETVSLDLNYADFLKLYKQAGDSSLIDLEIDGKGVGKVLVHEVQYNPVKDTPTHVDLRRIDMNKVMHAPVVLHFIGESPAVKALGGTLVQNLSQVIVECLPKDLVSFIEIDLSGLKTFEDMVKVKDLVLTPGLKVITPHGDALVVKVIPAMTEEEIKAMEEAGKDMDVSKIESAKKKEEETPVEGEAPAVATAEKKEEEKKPAEKK